ncbi:MAG: 50S ribosomal protein L30 [Candidatus Aenigmatarchaeota archaeon]|nr:50S ribosomal protein L30 [Candidatus Aenigmarchaeota archaeon]
MLFAVIRLRGSVKTSKEINDTLNMLKLKRVNHCVLLGKNQLGMIKKVKDYVTFGEVNKDTLVKLLEKRLKAEGNKKIDQEMLKQITKFKSFEEFAEALIKEKVKLKDFKKLKTVFRLNPPRKGLKSKRLSWPKGDLGYRKDKINDLIERMI